MENEVSKLDTPCWNGQTCLGSSEWLAENVKGIDQKVKEMLQLIEHDEDFLLEKVDSNHPKQPELIARIKEISHRHHLLADHYNKLTGELNSYSQSPSEMKNIEKTTFNPQLTPPFLTPMVKLRMNNVEGQVVGSDLSLSSGGGISDTTPNEGSEFSLLSSDSDSETYVSCANDRSSSLPSGKMLKHEIVNMGTDISEMESVIAQTEQEQTYDPIKVGGFGGYEMLLSRISDYEKELKVSNEKLLFAEEEIAKLKSELQNNETVMVKLGSIEAQLLSAKNQIKLQEAETEKENEKSLMLQRRIVDLEDELESKKKQLQELQDCVNNYTVELSNRDLEIQKLNAELQDASENFALDKWQFESTVSKLSERLIFHEARTKELQTQCELLSDENKKREAEKVEMQRKQEALKISWQVDIAHVRVELSEKDVQVNTLNENLDELKLKYDMLMAEKDGVNAKLQTLNADISCRDDQIQRLEHNLHELHCENKRLSAGSARTNKLTAELKSRIDELEKELRMQAVLISDMAEEKREAIRQLCVSIDYFRCAYEELRGAYVIRKRPTAMVS
ncbi:hypothetical protein DH2020_044295 [Rehmannia glutinosa]|uniref:NAB domain-containing protein n=1 Tax=Rehmannia glutinosa TaxID=99300 RepID=A0ABR0UHN1_REHGL